MKCPSKEIDKNNISLLLHQPQLSIVSLNCNIRFCLYLLLVLWCFCSLWPSGVYLGPDVGVRTLRSALTSTLSRLLTRLRGCLCLWTHHEASLRRLSLKRMDLFRPDLSRCFNIEAQIWDALRLLKHPVGRLKFSCSTRSLVVSPSSLMLSGFGLLKPGPQTSSEKRFLSSVSQSWALGVVTRSQSVKAKTVFALQTLIKEKHKNFEDESASCVLSHSPVKTYFFLHGRESIASL